MEIKERKTITEIKETIIGHKCDICEQQCEGEYWPSDWHYFSSHHENWGNDSIDSYEYHLVCSPKCYIEMLEKCIKNLNGYNTAIIDEMTIQFVKKFVKKLDQLKMIN